MQKVFINGTGSISAQNTFDGSFLEEEIIFEREKHVLPLVLPPYKEFIAPGLIRRMSPGVKNSVVASALALREAQNPELDAIITGTGVGCIKDSEDFLTAILQNDEAFLTPTSFIQSTHNTISAQIALGLKCKAYNMTYVQAAASFESALMDARLQLATGEAQNILVGGVEEKAEKMYRLFELAGLISDGEKGATFGEGSTFFVLGTEQTENSYAEIKNLQIANKIDNAEAFLETFLNKCALSKDDIDVVIVGKNDDVRFQESFDELLSLFPESVNKLHYKHLIGEYNSASAFGLWVAANILRRKQIPDVLYLNKKGKTAYKNILLYNQFRGLDHSVILVSAC